MDGRREFLNEDLKTWCQAEGIEQQVTAPCSPLQNGMAERMNHTLVKLGRAMLIAAKLPEFLWEPAIAHASYVWNHTYTVALPKETPYQRWYGKRPSVAHFQEFGMPVWILTQGQNVPCKLLPKSKRKAYVGYNDGSDSILYYNVKSRKILASHNHKNNGI